MSKDIALTHARASPSTLSATARITGYVPKLARNNRLCGIHSCFAPLQKGSPDSREAVRGQYTHLISSESDECDPGWENLKSMHTKVSIQVIAQLVLYAQRHISEDRPVLGIPSMILFF